MIKIMTINDQIWHEKLRYDINKEAAKVSALSSRKIHKYEYLTGEDILPSNQQQMIEQAKLVILLWEKILRNEQKQLKIKDKNRSRFWIL